MTAACTFALLVVGGFVHPTGSSLACPDWPLCYGEVFPEMTGGVEYEHTHRLVAGAVALLTCVLAVVAWRTSSQPRVRALAVALVAVVLLQALLGGITVLMRLPMLVSAAHLALSMVFFLMTLQMCFVLAPARLLPVSGAPERGLVTLALVATYVQVVLGGFVRHSGSGLACGPDLPLCNGDVWPSLPAAQVHQGHRMLGLVVTALVVAAASSAVREARDHRRRLALWLALAAPALVVTQVVLGVLTVSTRIGVAEVVAHLAVAALLLGTLFVLRRSLDPAASPARALRAAAQASS